MDLGQGAANGPQINPLAAQPPIPVAAPQFSNPLSQALIAKSLQDRANAFAQFQRQGPIAPMHALQNPTLQAQQLQLPQAYQNPMLQQMPLAPAIQGGLAGQ